VSALGAARAGLLTGIAPIAAAVTGMVALGVHPGLLVWLGIAVVAGGLVAGLRPDREMVTAAVPERVAPPAAVTAL